MKSAPSLYFEQSQTTISGVEFVLYVKFTVKTSRAGKLTVYLDKEDKFFVAESFIETRYRNKGYGKKLYEHALKELGTLKTKYFEASASAQRVWRSLEKKYKSRKDFFNGVLTLYNKPK